MIDGLIGDADRGALHQSDVLLHARTGLDYTDIERVMFSVGTAPGCHSPLLLLFHTLIERGHVRRVLELGSGCSTFYLAAMLQRVGGTLCTLENDPHWYSLYTGIMRDRGLPSGGYHLVDNLLGASDIVSAGAPYDLVFSDCSPGEQRFEGIDQYTPQLAEGCIILIDDCEQPARGAEAKAWAASRGADLSLFMSWSRGQAFVDPQGVLAKLASFHPPGSW